MALQVGQGIKDAMAAQQDHPIEDSTFTTNRDGSVVERALGTKGVYVASNATGQWETVFAGFTLAQ
jgi:hypothetical protein